MVSHEKLSSALWQFWTYFSFLWHLLCSCCFFELPAPCSSISFFDTMHNWCSSSCKDSTVVRAARLPGTSCATTERGAVTEGWPLSQQGWPQHGARRLLGLARPSRAPQGGAGLCGLRWGLSFLSFRLKWSPCCRCHYPNFSSFLSLCDLFFTKQRKFVQGWGLRLALL